MPKSPSKPAARKKPKKSAASKKKTTSADFSLKPVSGAMPSITLSEQGQSDPASQADSTRQAAELKNQEIVKHGGAISVPAPQGTQKAPSPKHQAVIDAFRKYEEASKLDDSPEKEKRIEKTIDKLREAAAKIKDNFDCQRIFGGVLARQRKFEEAGDVLEKAIENYTQEQWKHPTITETISNLAQALYLSKQYTRARPYYIWLVAHKPDVAVNHNRYGRVMNLHGNDGEALRGFERAILLLQQQLRNISEEEQYKKIEKEMLQYRCNRALIMLRQGRWLRAWNEFQHRFKVFNLHQVKLDADIPEWNGLQPIEGKNLVLLPEQGVGDSIMMLRYLPLIRQMGARSIFFAEDSTYRLYEKSRLFDRVLSFGEKSIKPDYQVFLFSLPCVFKSIPDEIPNEGPYFHAEPGFFAENNIDHPADKLKIGIVWGGNPDFPNDWYRSVKIEKWGPIFAARPDAKFYSLQVGEAHEKEIKKTEFDEIVTPLAPYFKDYYDTARAIQELDLVITVDTSVGHIAGCLLKPTFLMLSNGPDWRWLRGRDNSVWYAEHQLFRQVDYMDWNPVVASVAKKLEEFDPATYKPQKDNPLITTIDVASDPA